MNRNLVSSFLIDDIVSNNCILFVGSGIGKPDLPTGPELAEELSTAAGYVGPLMPLPKAAQYYCQHCDGGRRRRLMKFLKRRLLSCRYPTKAQWLVASIPYFRIIVTTNYDLLLDRALNVVPIVEDGDLAYWDEGERQLIKLHGCISRPSTIVITEEDYAKFQALRLMGLLCTHVRNLMATRTVLFVGYSLDDPNFRVIYEQIISGIELQGQSYAVQVNPSQDDIDYWKGKGVSIIAATAEDFLLAIQSKLITKKLIVDPAQVSIVMEERRCVLSKYERLESVESAYVLPATYQEGVLEALAGLEAAIERGLTWQELDNQLSVELAQFEDYAKTGEVSNFVSSGGRTEALWWFLKRRGRIPAYFSTKLGRPVYRKPYLQAQYDIYERIPETTERWYHNWTRIRRLT